MRDILGGKKKYLVFDELKTIEVPKFKAISVHKVFEKVKENRLIMSYIPDFDPAEIEPKHALDREFFFNVINTLDPDFFPTAIESLEQQRSERRGAGEPENLQVEIIPELFNLVQYGVGGRAGNAARSLAALRRGA